MKRFSELIGRGCALAAGFVRWWINELLLSLPLALRRRLTQPREQNLVRILHDALQTRRLDAPVDCWDTISVPDGASRLKLGTAALLLAKATVLRRTMQLPLAAEASLHETASYQVARLTPFKLDEVFHVARVVERNREQRTVLAEIAVIPRELLRRSIAKLEGYPVELSAILVEEDAHQPAFDFLPQCAGRSATQKSAWSPILAGSLALLLASPFFAAYRIHTVATALLTKVDEAARLAHQASAIRDEIEALSRQEAFLPERLRSLQAIDALEALSRLTPDNAWAFRIEIHPKEASLSGFTTDLPALLQQLANPPFVAPELTSPVVQGLAGGQTRFDLRVKFRDGT